MLYTILTVLVVAWLVGLVFEIGGGLIHLLLIAAALVLLYKMFAGRGAAEPR